MMRAPPPDYFGRGIWLLIVLAALLFLTGLSLLILYW